jgi:hypothetical protein
VFIISQTLALFLIMRFWKCIKSTLILISLIPILLKKSKVKVLWRRGASFLSLFFFLFYVCSYCYFFFYFTPPPQIHFSHQITPSSPLYPITSLFSHFISVIKAGRSNNELDTTKLEKEFPNIPRMPGACEALFQRMKEHLDKDPNCTYSL